MLKIGADPELFCYDVNKKQFISAHTFFPGTKQKPLPVNRGALQLDGLAAELNIDPAETAKEFVEALYVVQQQARKYLPKGVQLVNQPSVVFDPEYYKSLPENTKEIGCTPDFNAWEEGLQNVTKPAEEESLRAAGGHIHLGFLDILLEDEFSEEHMNLCCSVVKQLDASVGLQSLIWDEDDKRRLLYGKAGAFRPKKYGLEYRTPSNVWLESAKKMESVFNLTQKAYNDLQKGLMYNLLLPYNVQEIIDSGNRELAKEALNAVLVA